MEFDCERGKRFRTPCRITFVSDSTLHGRLEWHSRDALRGLCLSPSEIEQLLLTVSCRAQDLKR